MAFANGSRARRQSIHLVSETAWAASGTRSPQTSQTLPSMALIPAMQSLHTGKRAALVRASPQMRQSDGKTTLRTLAKADEKALRREKSGGDDCGTSCPATADETRTRASWSPLLLKTPSRF